MSHDRQGSYGPFGYAIVAADVAANANTTPRQAEHETPPTKTGSLFTNLRDFAASITRSRHARTT